LNYPIYNLFIDMAEEAAGTGSPVTQEAVETTTAQGGPSQSRQPTVERHMSLLEQAQAKKREEEAAAELTPEAKRILKLKGAQGIHVPPTKVLEDIAAAKEKELEPPTTIKVGGKVVRDSVPPIRVPQRKRKLPKAA
jgi:hypothetical protein